MAFLISNNSSHEAIVLVAYLLTCIFYVTKICGKIKMEEKSQETAPNPNSNGNNIPTVQKAHELMYSFQPALMFEKLYGIFRFNYKNGGLSPTSKKMKFFSLLIASTYVVLFMLYLKFPEAITGTSKLVDVMDEVPSIVILTQYFLSAIKTSFLLSNCNIRLFKTFTDLDFKLHIGSNRDFYNKCRKMNIKFLIILIFVHVTVSVGDLLTEDEAISMGKIVVLPIYLEQALELSVFCIMIWMLIKRLAIINKYLAVFIDEKDNKLSVFSMSEKITKPKEYNLIGRSSPNNMKIRELAVTYDMIGEICALINNIFNFQIFMSLFATFTYIVITIWTSIYYFREPAQQYGSLITIIVWCVTGILIVGLMSLTCERLLVTRNETKILVNKIIMDYDLPKNMRVQAKAFMELVEAWPLRIFIYDMFSVDISLMLKFISVATTYLIVIIQISHFL
jgi:hypothetical protein